MKYKESRYSIRSLLCQNKLESIFSEKMKKLVCTAALVLLLVLIVSDVGVSLIKGQQITCATTRRGKFNIQFTDLHEWMTAKNISQSEPLQVQRTSGSKEITEHRVYNNNWVFDRNIFDLDIYERFFFRLVGRTNRSNNETLSEFHFPGRNNTFTNTWTRGLRLKDAQDCFKDSNSYFVIKGTCRSLEILSVNKDYAQLLLLPVMDTFRVNGEEYKYTSAFGLTRRYKGDILQPNHQNNICIDVILNWREQQICERLEPECPTPTTQQKVVKKDNETNTTLILAFMFGVLSLLLFIALIFVRNKDRANRIYGNLKNYIRPRNSILDRPLPIPNERIPLHQTDQDCFFPRRPPQNENEDDTIPRHQTNHNYDKRRNIDNDNNSKPQRQQEREMEESSIPLHRDYDNNNLSIRQPLEDVV